MVLIIIVNSAAAVIGNAGALTVVGLPYAICVRATNGHAVVAWVGGAHPTVSSQADSTQ